MPGTVQFNFRYDKANQILFWDQIPGAESYTIYHAGEFSPIPPVGPPWLVLCSNTPVNFYHVAPDGFGLYVCGQVNPQGSWGSPSPVDPRE